MCDLQLCRACAVSVGATFEGVTAVCLELAEIILPKNFLTESCLVLNVSLSSLKERSLLRTKKGGGARACGFLRNLFLQFTVFSAVTLRSTRMLCLQSSPVDTLPTQTSNGQLCAW